MQEPDDVIQHENLDWSGGTFSVFLLKFRLLHPVTSGYLAATLGHKMAPGIAFPSCEITLLRLKFCGYSGHRSAAPVQQGSVTDWSSTVQLASMPVSRLWPTLCEATHEKTVPLYGSGVSSVCAPNLRPAAIACELGRGGRRTRTRANQPGQ